MIAEVAEAAAGAESAGLAAVVALAVVQGLTEFLPVSSSGHLVLTGELLALPQAGLFLGVALHVGTLGAVFSVYGRDLLFVLREALGGRPRELLLLALGSVPAAALGLGFHDWLEGAFRDVRVAGLGLFATAALLALGDRARRLAAPTPERALGAGDALWIGCAQALALVPGISRSGSTISAGLFRGLPPRAAARFSFLLSVPAVGGAALLESLDLAEATEGGLGLGVLLVAIGVSWVVGFVALRWLLAVLERGAFRWFAVYCAVVGAVSLAVLG